MRKQFMRIRGRGVIAFWIDMLVHMLVCSLPLLIYIAVVEGALLEFSELLKLVMIFFLLSTPILSVALLIIGLSPLFTEMYATIKNGELKVNGEIIDLNSVKQIDYSLFENIGLYHKGGIDIGEIYVRIWVKDFHGLSKHIAVPHASYGFYRTLVRLCPDADHYIIANGGIKKWLKWRLITLGLGMLVGVVLMVLTTVIEG